ncbi:MAG: VCBS repeat-containing protein, partial [Pirellulales bacterium]
MTKTRAEDEGFNLSLIPTPEPESNSVLVGVDKVAPIGDFNGDGETDFVFGGQYVFTRPVDLNKVTNVREAADYVLPYNFTTAGDFNGDGLADIVLFANQGGTALFNTQFGSERASLIGFVLGSREARPRNLSTSGSIQYLGYSTDVLALNFTGQRSSQGLPMSDLLIAGNYRGNPSKIGTNNGIVVSSTELVRNNFNAFYDVAAVINYSQQNNPLPRPTVLKGFAANGLDAIAYGTRTVTSQTGIVVPDVYSAKDLPTLSGLLSPDTRVDLTVEGTTNFVIRDIEPQKGTDSVVAQIKAKIVDLGLPYLLQVKADSSGKIALLSPQDQKITSIRETVRNTTTVPMLIGPAAPSDGKTSFATGLVGKFTVKDSNGVDQQFYVNQDFSYLTQYNTSFELKNLSDEFSLFLNPTLFITDVGGSVRSKGYLAPDSDEGISALGLKYRDAVYIGYNWRSAGEYMPIPENFSYSGDGFAIKLDSRATPAVMVQELNRQLQTRKIQITQTWDSMEVGGRSGFSSRSSFDVKVRSSATTEYGLRAVLKDNKVVVEVYSAQLVGQPSVELYSKDGKRLMTFSGSASFGAPGYSNLGRMNLYDYDNPVFKRPAFNFEVRNVKRDFTSVLGFAKGFNVTFASQGQVDFGASSVVAPIAAQQPWYYTLANGPIDDGVYLGTANSSGSAIYGSNLRRGNSSPEEFRIWVATNSDPSFLNRAPDLTITGAPLNIRENGYNSFVDFEPRAFTATVGDFNGDGKPDLAVKRALPNNVVGYNVEQRVGIFYGITDKIAAGIKTIEFVKADAWVV